MKQYKILKTGSVLLVCLLAAVVSIGVASATPQSVYFGNVTITDGMLALTHDVPNWLSSDPIGDFVPAASAIGILREVSLKDANFTYNATYNNTTGAFTIIDINGQTAGDNEMWFAFIDEESAENIAVLAANNSTVEFFVANQNLSDYSEISQTDEGYSASVIVTVAAPVYNVSGNVTVSVNNSTNTITAIDVLNAAKAQNLINTFNYTWVNDYYNPNVQYAWLTDINGVPTYDWTTTGYGYALIKNGTATASLDQTYFTENTTYEIFMGANIYAGNYPGNSSNEYYIDGVTERLLLNVTVTANA